MKRLLSANKECDLLHRGTSLVMGMPWTFGREGSYHLARKKTPASYSQEVPCLPGPLLHAGCTLFPESVKLVVVSHRKETGTLRDLGIVWIILYAEYCQSR